VSPSPAYRHPVGPLRQIDRDTYLESAATGQYVIHLGFADVVQGIPPSTVPELHRRLAGRAEHLIGIDSSGAGVGRAVKDGFEAYKADCQDIAELKLLNLQQADLVIAGELIEHVESPGSLLRAAQTLVKPGGALIVTTPNGLSGFNFMSAALRREYIHPDHICIFTPYTLTRLAHVCSWTVQEMCVYAMPRVGKSTEAHAMWSRPLRYVMRRAIPAASTLLSRLSPALADGLVARLAPGESARRCE